MYISKSDLHDVKRAGKSATDTARLLVPKIFSKKAFQECSVTGRPAAGKGKEHAVIRPPLHADGVTAIHGNNIDSFTYFYQVVCFILEYLFIIYFSFRVLQD